jgi:hypothetical protein
MEIMNRRDLLSAGLSTSVVAASAAINSGSKLVVQGKKKLDPKIKELEERFDKLEHHHKNLIRVGSIAFAMSTGIDLISFF